MTPLPGLPRARPARRWRVVALASVALLVAFVAVFDWTWLRPIVRQYVRSHADRAIDFEHLRVGLAPDLALRVEVRGLRIENAAWAAKRPFIDAGFVRADIDWRSLAGPQVIVTRAVLVDANVDMERSADGLRNWRLSKPLDRGPGRVRVLALEATRSTVHVADAGMALSAELQFTPLTPDLLPVALATAPMPTATKHLVVKGTYRGRPFDGDAAVGAVISFRDSGIPFALRGELRSGAARLRFDGRAADIQQGTSLDLQLNLELRLSSAPAQAPPSAGRGLPVTASAHLIAARGQWSLDALNARLGRTDVQGQARLQEADTDHARGRVSAALHSTAWHTDELAALGLVAGGGTAVGGKTAGVGNSAVVDKAAVIDNAAANGPSLSLPAVDGTVDWQVDKVVHPAWPWLQSLQLRAALDQGRLTVKPVMLLAAPGRAEGRLTLDTTVRPWAMALAADVSGVQVGQWTQALHGVLQGHVALDARADSWPALARAAVGSATFALRDASISNRLDARLALDGGAMLAARFTDAQRVAMPCARLALQVAGGHLTVRSFVTETDRAVFVGTGALNLADRTIDVLVTPHRKTLALFALNRAIHVSGPLTEPVVATADAPGATAPAGCAAAG